MDRTEAKKLIEEMLDSLGDGELKSALSALRKKPTYDIGEFYRASKDVFDKLPSISDFMIKNSTPDDLISAAELIAEIDKLLKPRKNGVILTVLCINLTTVMASYLDLVGKSEKDG